MGACEKCWADAYLRSCLLGGSQAEHYRDLLRERADNPCTPADVRLACKAEGK